MHIQLLYTDKISFKYSCDVSHRGDECSLTSAMISASACTIVDTSLLVAFLSDQ